MMDPNRKKVIDPKLGKPIPKKRRISSISHYRISTHKKMLARKENIVESQQRGIIKVSVAPNRYFGKRPENINNLRLALSLMLKQEQNWQADRIERYIKDTFPEDVVKFEDYSDDNAFHFLLFVKDYLTVKQILEEGLKGMELHSNLDNRKIKKEFLLQKANQYARQVDAH